MLSKLTRKQEFVSEVPIVQREFHDRREIEEPLSDRFVDLVRARMEASKEEFNESLKKNSNHKVASIQEAYKQLQETWDRVKDDLVTCEEFNKCMEVKIISTDLDKLEFERKAKDSKKLTEQEKE